jgi:DNA-binding NarL/FixJ family response regulator
MNILIADDHVGFRAILESACSEVLGDVTITSVAEGATAVRLCQRQTFALILVALQLPDMDGFTVAEIAISHLPHAAIVALSSGCTDFTAYRAEKRRVRGFIDKRGATIPVLREAVAKVAANGVYFSPVFLQLNLARKRDSMSFDKILSDREMEVLSLIAMPLNDREIAAALGISPQTAEKHRFNLLRKLSLANTTELSRFARDRGIVHQSVVVPRQIATG